MEESIRYAQIVEGYIANVILLLPSSAAEFAEQAGVEIIEWEEAIAQGYTYPPIESTPNWRGFGGALAEHPAIKTWNLALSGFPPFVLIVGILVSDLVLDEEFFKRRWNECVEFASPSKDAVEAISGFATMFYIPFGFDAEGKVS